MIEDPLALTTVIVAITALSFWLARNFGWGTKLGASLLVIFLGALLANLDIVPPSSAVYGVIGGPVTSLAIVWITWMAVAPVPTTPTFLPFRSMPSRG